MSRLSTPLRRAASRLRGLASRFRRDDRAVYAVEFGLLAFPFFGILFATLEVGWVSYNAERLQAAVNDAARQVMTGKVQNASYPATAAAFISNVLCPANPPADSPTLPGSWNCSNIIVDVRTAANFAATDTANDFYTTTPQYCLGNPSTIVVMRVVYPLPSFLPLSIYNRYIGLANNYPGVSGWVHVLMGTAVFKTEPYTGSSPTC